MNRTLLTCLCLLLPGAVNAQDFEFAAPGPRFAMAAAFLEQGLPPARSTWVAEGLSTSRHAIPQLATRGLALAGGWRMLRIATGLSQTGEPDLGWTAGAAAVGIAGDGIGLGARAAVRRDRWWLAEETALGAGLGAEAGMGAWIRPTPRVDVWVAAPQLWTRGSEPPLERGLHIGSRVRWYDMAVWFEQAMRAPGVTPNVFHRVGVSLEAGSAHLWAAALDAPLRASVGVAASLPWLAVAAEVESHPVLGETLRLALQLAPAR